MVSYEKLSLRENFALLIVTTKEAAADFLDEPEEILHTIIDSDTHSVS